MHDLSDHFPIFMTLNFDTSFQEQSPQNRVFDKRKMEQLNEYLMEKLQNYQMITDPNEACNILTQSYMDGIAKFSKLFKYSRRSTPLKPWITPGILCCINRKSKSYKKMLKNSSVENEIKYKQYRNILTNVLRDAKKFYFQKSFEENKYNGKKHGNY